MSHGGWPCYCFEHGSLWAPPICQKVELKTKQEIDRV